MAKILVIGGSKGIGKATVQAALARGHEVTAFSRSPEKIGIEHASLSLMAGDATKGTDLAPALQGVDAVVVALGIEESISMIWKPVHLFSQATGALLPEMQKAGVMRLIAVTGVGAGDSRRALGRLERLGHEFILGEPYKDKTRQEAMIKQSNTEWTIVRPVILTNGSAVKAPKVLTEPAQWRLGLVSRKTVAEFIVDEVETGAHIRQAPVISH